MRLLRLIFFLQFVFMANSFACEGLREGIDTIQSRSLKSSDNIFLGFLERFDTINLTLKFKVIENFKGRFEKKFVTIKWESHNHTYYEDKSLWIVYSNRINDTTFILNEHGLTRSVLHPEVIPSYEIPPPFPFQKCDNREFYDFLKKCFDYKIIPLKDWYAEVEMLRDFSRNQLEEENNRKFDYQTYFYFSMLFNLIILCLMVYGLFKLKRNNR